MKKFVRFIIWIVTSSNKMGVPIINNYYCLEKISKGAFGEVWKGIQKDSYNINEPVKKETEIAIKI